MSEVDHSVPDSVYKSMEEEKWINMVFLLRYRYKGKVGPCAKALNIPAGRLAQLSDRYDFEAQRVMKANWPQMRIVDEAIPTMEDLIDKCLIRLNDIIGAGKEADRVANALVKLYSLQAVRDKLSSEDINEEDIYANINETLKLGIREIRTNRDPSQMVPWEKKLHDRREYQKNWRKAKTEKIKAEKKQQEEQNNEKTES